MGKAGLLEAPYGLEHTMPVGALRENCQSSLPQLCFRDKHLTRGEPLHPAAPNTKPACPETHTASSHGESTQYCCKYSSCSHKGRAASPVNLNSLNTHSWYIWAVTFLGGAVAVGAPAARWAIPLVHAPRACSPRASPANSPFQCRNFYIRNQQFLFLSPPPASIRCWLSTRCSKSIPQEQDQAQEISPFQPCGTNFSIPSKIPPLVFLSKSLCTSPRINITSSPNRSTQSEAGNI